MFETVHFKYVWLLTCQSHLSKAVKNKRGLWWTQLNTVCAMSSRIWALVAFVQIPLFSWWQIQMVYINDGGFIVFLPLPHGLDWVWAWIALSDLSLVAQWLLFLAIFRNWVIFVASLHLQKVTLQVCPCGLQGKRKGGMPLSHLSGTASPNFAYYGLGSLGNISYSAHRVTVD